MITWIIVAIAIVFVLALCLALAVASFSFDNYAEKLNACSAISNSYGWTTLEFVDAMNNNHFGGKLKLARTKEWDDHYSTGVVALSDKTMKSNSLASLAIIAHELGHAKQDAGNSNTLKKFWRLCHAGRVLGLFILPFILVGLVLCLLWVFDVLPQLYVIIAGATCFAAGLVIFGFAIVLKAKEITIEKQASNFAMEFLNDYLSEEELSVCREFLNSARLTYWGGLIRSILGWTMLTGKDKLFK